MKGKKVDQEPKAMELSKEERAQVCIQESLKLVEKLNNQIQDLKRKISVSGVKESRYCKSELAQKLNDRQGVIKAIQLLVGDANLSQYLSVELQVIVK